MVYNHEFIYDKTSVHTKSKLAVSVALYGKPAKSQGECMRVWGMKLWAMLLLAMLFAANAQMAFSYYKKLPDLTVVALTCATMAKAGGMIQNVAAEILNQGKRPAGAFRLKYYLSQNNSLSADDVDTGTICEWTELGRKTSSLCTVNVNVPASLMQGQYYLIAYVDQQNSVSEKDEENNSKAFGPLTIEKVIEDDDPPPPLPLPQGKIRVDGDPDDWQTITPLYTDEAGDGPYDASGEYQPGSDIVHISVTNDNQDVFFLVEFAGAAHAGGLNLFFDTDVNPTTGCSSSETVIFSSSAEPYSLKAGDYTQCVLAESQAGAVISAIGEKNNRSYLEASISIEDLFRLTPGRREFRFHAKTVLAGLTDEVWPPTVYPLTARFDDGANLRMAFHSETVSGDSSKPCGTVVPGWHYGLTLEETAGVGVSIISYQTVLYDRNGGYLMTIGTSSGNDFARLFADCGEGSAYIKANSKACSESLCLNLGGRSAGQLDITFNGIDDKGHPVRFTSGRLILQN